MVNIYIKLLDFTIAIVGIVHRSALDLKSKFLRPLSREMYSVAPIK
jgi:hypothetical protein